MGLLRLSRNVLQFPTIFTALSSSLSYTQGIRLTVKEFDSLFTYYDKVKSMLVFVSAFIYTIAQKCPYFLWHYTLITHTALYLRIHGFELMNSFPCIFNETDANKHLMNAHFLTIAALWISMPVGQSVHHFRPPTFVQMSTNVLL